MHAPVTDAAALAVLDPAAMSCPRRSALPPPITTRSPTARRLVHARHERRPVPTAAAAHATVPEHDAALIVSVTPLAMRCVALCAMRRALYMCALCALCTLCAVYAVCCALCTHARAHHDTLIS